jgi:phospholipid-transporting ATPase
MNLDGETNLKNKLIPAGLKGLNKDTAVKLEGAILCEPPNENLEKWDGSLTISDKMTQPVLIGLNQLVLKGCKLKNTNYIIGVIVYVGHNTKIMKNAKKPVQKRSNIMKVMNWLLCTVFLFLICLSVAFSGGYYYWEGTKGANFWYLATYKNDIKTYPHVVPSDFFIKFFTYVVAYSHVIPISLYVALEIVKLIQSILIFYDDKMVDPASGKAAVARTSDLIEELGQIEFIFSDKTGTLTRNEMEFRQCAIGFNIYGNNPELESNAINTINGEAKAYEKLKSFDPEGKAIEEFFTILSVCHSAYIDESDNTFQSSSPDEVALVLGAAQFGFKLVKKTSETLEIMTANGEYLIFELILELPFDSYRKRMSNLVKITQDGVAKYFLFTKGADSSMLTKIPMIDSLCSQVKEILEKFALEGLRTLVIAKKQLNERDVNRYLEQYNKISFNQCENKDKQIKLLFEQLESSLEYVGCTAIEDKLQEGVPETIELLLKANIKIWVLTGDKMTTAIEIGKLCRLVLNEGQMDHIILATEGDVDETRELFLSKLEYNYKRYILKKGTGIFNSFDTDDRKKFMIIDGKNLAHVLDDPIAAKKFFEIGLMCNSVICCRVSPLQKSQIVKLAKAEGKWLTLSIGDGANDVPMIMEAHIGVGISGKEGTQAVRSADYSIGQFQFLQRLLLVHGRYGYRRISLFICYYFYKNIVCVFTEVYFSIYNGFSGQIFFPDLLPLAYNAFFTSWPCIFTYSIEKDVNEEMSLRFPYFYCAGQLKYYFSMKRFWIWMFYAFLHGLIVFVGTMYLTNENLNGDGKLMNHWFYTTLSFTCIVHTVTLKIFIDSMYWNKFTMYNYLNIALYPLAVYCFTIYVW